MIKNKIRIGNFTSSDIVKLTKVSKDRKGFGVPALTYIEETNMERRLGRSLADEATARPLTWGSLLEGRVFDKLGLEYTLSSTETIQHPQIDYWAGSPDGTKEDTVIDIKCPLTLKSFCHLVDPLYQGLTGMEAMDAIRENHPDGDKFYWQLVSNSILTGKRFAELIVYVPYFAELIEIKQMAQRVAPDELSRHYWIAWATEDELPYLIPDVYYRNLNIVSFEVPQTDKDLLTDCVTRAGAMLVNRPAVPEPVLLTPVIQEF